MVTVDLLLHQFLKLYLDYINLMVHQGINENCKGFLQTYSLSKMLRDCISLLLYNESFIVTFVMSAHSELDINATHHSFVHLSESVQSCPECSRNWVSTKVHRTSMYKQLEPYTITIYHRHVMHVSLSKVPL